MQTSIPGPIACQSKSNEEDWGRRSAPERSAQVETEVKGGGIDLDKTGRNPNFDRLEDRLGFDQIGQADQSSEDTDVEDNWFTDCPHHRLIQRQFDLAGGMDELVAADGQGVAVDFSSASSSKT